METIEFGKSQKTMSGLLQKALKKAMTYDGYRAYTTQLSLTGKTSGEKQSEDLVGYTLLNVKRMKRLDRTLKVPSTILEDLGGPIKKQYWLVLTESWCADAAQSLPVMNKIASLYPSIFLRIVLRDENLELMSFFLTGGSLSIPKLIAIDAGTGNVIGQWGPRPSRATVLASDHKRENGFLTPEFKELLQVWYNKDKGENIMQDLLRLLALE
ncbi:MAG: thioredoxin family protein [Sediminicola sp.]|tara:strand:+ start:161525 stop:162160 length:636 start_codon:yes stop_codon:yes gene_type:complete